MSTKLIIEEQIPYIKKLIKRVQGVTAIEKRELEQDFLLYLLKVSRYYDSNKSKPSTYISMCFGNFMFAFNIDANKELQEVKIEDKHKEYIEEISPVLEGIEESHRYLEEILEQASDIMVEFLSRKLGGEPVMSIYRDIAEKEGVSYVTIARRISEELKELEEA